MDKAIDELSSRHQEIEPFLSLLTWYAATPSIVRRGGQLRYVYARKGVALSLPDMLIAATALEHGLTLITGNRKHFPMPELSIYSTPGPAGGNAV